MPRAGRPPLRSQLVDNLKGGELEKLKLRAILATISGEWSTQDAANALGCNEARFYALRVRTLQEALDGLVPRKPGPKARAVDPKDEEIARLRHELELARHDMATLGVQLELAKSGLTARSKKNAERGVSRRAAGRGPRQAQGRIRGQG